MPNFYISKYSALLEKALTAEKREEVKTRARWNLSSLFLSRDFGQSAESFYEEHSEIAEFQEWFLALR